MKKTYTFGDAVNQCFDAVETILWRYLLHRDPVELLYKASCHVLESHAGDPHASDALEILYDARVRAIDERRLQTLKQAMVNQ